MISSWTDIGSQCDSNMVGLDGVSWRGFWANWGPQNTTKRQRERVSKPSLGPTATRNLVFSLFLDIKYSTKCSLKVSAISAWGLAWIYQHGAQSYHHCDIELSFRIFKSQSVSKIIPVDLHKARIALIWVICFLHRCDLRVDMLIVYLNCGVKETIFEARDEQAKKLQREQ